MDQDPRPKARKTVRCEGRDTKEEVNIYDLIDLLLSRSEKDLLASELYNARIKI